jgi:hypothetical protein
VILFFSIRIRRRIMNEQALSRGTNRREMLKWSGMGVLAGAATGVVTPGKVRADAAGAKILHASWIHGNTMAIEYPDRIAFQEHVGYHFEVEGNPGTSNWFHFSIPTPVIINDVRLRIKAAMLVFATDSVDAFVRDVHVYDGSKRIGVFDDVYLSENAGFVKFDLPDRPQVFWGIGISVGVGFGVEMMGHRMRFLSAGCDFTLQEPEQ